MSWRVWFHQNRHRLAGSVCSLPFAPPLLHPVFRLEGDDWLLVRTAAPCRLSSPPPERFHSGSPLCLWSCNKQAGLFLVEAAVMNLHLCFLGALELLDGFLFPDFLVPQPQSLLPCLPGNNTSEVKIPPAPQPTMYGARG